MIGDILTNLAACLCEQVRESDTPELCYCGVMPGELVALDYVGMCKNKKDGMAWTRMTMSYPASAVGVINTLAGNCSAGLGIEIEMGVIRSAPMMGRKGEPPTAEAQAEALRIQLADMMSLFKAVACCSDIQSHDYILSQYRPMGPQGLALGGMLTVMVAL